MKFLFTLLITFIVFSAKSQQIDSVYVNLYTDSLKKGTYNYINVDGLMNTGRYLPLDSNHIIFKCSHGKFYGNSLWIEKDIKVAKVDIQLLLKKDNSVVKNLEMYIKTMEDGPLKTEEEILAEMKQQKKNKKNKE